MNTSDVQTVVVEHSDKEFESFLHNQIKSFNNRSSALFRNVRVGPDAPKPLNIHLDSRDGTTIGGISSSTYWGWLVIEDFYLPEKLRGKGLGSEILAEVEITARKRGCVSAQLTTYDFQAREFYLKRGWRVVGELKGYPPGSTYCWMRKDFD